MCNGVDNSRETSNDGMHIWTTKSAMAARRYRRTCSWSVEFYCCSCHCCCCFWCPTQLWQKLLFVVATRRIVCLELDCEQRPAGRSTKSLPHLLLLLPTPLPQSRMRQKRSSHFKWFAMFPQPYRKSWLVSLRKQSLFQQFDDCSLHFPLNSLRCTFLLIASPSLAPNINSYAGVKWFPNYVVSWTHSLPLLY